MTGLTLDEEPARPVRVVIALGANLGERLEALQSAVASLASFEGITVVAISPVFETSPVGGPPDQPDYLNAVVLARTRLSPLGLLAACQSVEAEHGRRRVVRWGPRTLDVDIVTYGDLVASGADLQLPHPRAQERPFVLAPWLAADAAATLPSPDGPRPVADLLEALRDKAPGEYGAERVRECPDLRLRLP